MTKTHAHRAEPSRHKMSGWTHCIAGRPCSGRAHGGVAYYDECKCGARRAVEANGRWTVSSGWQLPEPSVSDHRERTHRCLAGCQCAASSIFRLGR